MITRTQLRAIAKARVDDAETLFANDRFDGAAYLCGYAIELVLKARICTTLKWSAGFPLEDHEFKGTSSFKTHKFPDLLHLSGRPQVPPTHLPDWSTVLNWKPENRYQPIGTVTSAQARSMIDATKRLMRVL